MNVYPHGVKELTVPAGEKIALYSRSPVKLFKKVGYPNQPESWYLVATTVAGTEYLSAAFTNETVVRVEPSEDECYYEVGAAPSIYEPSGNLSMSAAVGLISGLAAAQGGSLTIKGGTSSTAGNAGGAAGILGGQPGATGVGGAAAVTGGAGGATSGKGGAASVVGGAGTAGNGAGGSVLLIPGAPHGSGLAGGVFNRGTYQFRKQAAQVDKADGNQSVTAAQLINGICVHTVTTGRTLTTPTGAAISAACPADLAVGDSFDFTLITIGAGADDISTLTPGDGNVTIVGEATVGPSGSTFNCYGTFRFRNTAANTWVAYRVG
jgi:hypothetical protein